MRMLVTLFWLRVETRAQVWPRLLIVAVLYGILVAFKLLFGYCIKVLAHYNGRYYNRKYGGKSHVGRPTAVSRVVMATVTGHLAAPAPTPAPPAPGLGWGPAVSAPLPNANAQLMPQYSASPAPGPPMEAGPTPTSDGLPQSVFSQSFIDVQAGTAPVAMMTVHGGVSSTSRGAPSTWPLQGTVPRRLSGPVAGLGTICAGTGQTAAGSGLTTALLTPLPGLGADAGVTSAGHAKVD